MSTTIPLIPYTRIIGQENLKFALELTHIAPRIGGVLIKGQRGTGKTTTARAFAMMVYGKLPVTLPINATEDRVVGGWDILELMKGETKWKDGLIKQADGGVLFIDEVNLLDDHLVNIILDVTSTGILTVQREGQDKEGEHVSFILVGTMNPDEAELRAQFLDRFGLVVSLEGEEDIERRRQIIETVMQFDEAVAQWRAISKKPDFFVMGEATDAKKLHQLNQARDRLPEIKITQELATLCAKIGQKFKTQGHRADYLLAFAARACAALSKDTEVTLEHIIKVAPLVLTYRRFDVVDDKVGKWEKERDEGEIIQLLDS